MEKPIRLLRKKQVLARVQLSYATVWKKMIAGTFPRSRVVGGRVRWLASEIDEWILALPKQTLKGDN